MLRDTTIKLEGVVEGIHHHLLLFVHISPNKGLAAMAQAEMGNLYLTCNSAQNDMCNSPIFSRVNL